MNGFAPLEIAKFKLSFMLFPSIVFPRSRNGVVAMPPLPVLQDDVVKAYRLLSGFNRDQYEQQMLSFSTAQKKLLVALSHERTREFDDAYRVKYRLGASSTVNSAKKKLMENGYIEMSEGKYCVADPFFAEFLRD